MRASRFVGSEDSKITCEHNDSHSASTESTDGSSINSIASPAGAHAEENTLNVGVCPARPGSARRMANAHSCRVVPSKSASRTQTNTMPDLRCAAISSTISDGIVAFLPCSRRPITSISGMREPCASEVFEVRNGAIIVIASMSLTKRCFVLAEIGTFAANSPFGRFAFSAGMAVAFGKPRVSAVTEPQEAIIIAGLLSFEWRSGHIGVRCQ